MTTAAETAAVLADLDGRSYYTRGLSAAEWLRLIRDPRHLVVTSTDDAGTVNAVALLRRRGERLDLLRLAVDPDRRREGIGRRLVAAVGLRHRLRLRLRETNRDGLEFAIACGFEVRRLERGGFGAGTDAVILTRPTDAGM